MSPTPIEVKRRNLQELTRYYNVQIEKLNEDEIVAEWIMRGYTEKKVKEHIGELRRSGRLKCKDCKKFPAQCDCMGCGCP